jgi:hypothetical protein
MLCSFQLIFNSTRQAANESERVSAPQLIKYKLVYADIT